MKKWVKSLNTGLWNLSISAKISIMILFIISISLFISGYVNLTYTKALMKTEVEASLASKNEAIVNQIDAVFHEKAAVVQQLGMNQQVLDYLKTATSHDDALVSPQYKDVAATLDRIYKSDNTFSLVYVVSEKGSFDIGNHGHLTGTDFKVKERPWYEAAVKATDVAFTDPYVDYTSGKMVVSIFHPVREDGVLLGFVAVDMFLDSLPQIMESYQYGQAGYSFLVTKDGTVIYHPNKQYVMNKKLTNRDGAMGRLGSKIAMEKKGVQFVDDSETQEYISYSPVALINWTVAIAIPAREVTAGVAKLSNTIILCFTASGSVLVFIVYFLLRFMLRPIPYMIEAIKNISSGDLSTRLAVKSKDEIGQVMISLNKMAEQLGWQKEQIESQKKAIERTGTEMISALAQAIEVRDSNTGGHCQRVADMAYQIGKQMGMNELELLHLHWAGIVHDIGKIGIPENILNKQGNLTEEERSIMQKHPVMGAKILSKTNYSKYIYKGVRHHHERVDGNGYPDRIKGDEIALQAKIISISDVWDALTSDRPYKKPMSFHEAIAIMKKGEGTQFDPEALQAFFHVIIPESTPLNLNVV